MTAELNALDIERRLTKIEATLEATLPTFATKADLHALETRLITWMVGAVVAAATAARAIVSVISRFWISARERTKTEAHGDLGPVDVCGQSAAAGDSPAWSRRRLASAYTSGDSAPRWAVAMFSARWSGLRVPAMMVWMSGCERV